VGSIPQQVALASRVSAEALASTVTLVGTTASILVLLVEVAAGALAPTGAVPAQKRTYDHQGRALLLLQAP